MSTQLRLVDTPDTRPTAAATTRRATSRGRTSPKRTTVARAGRGGRRAVNWGAWRLDARTRSVGRAGVARARRALEDAVASEELSKAS